MDALLNITSRNNKESLKFFRSYTLYIKREKCDKIKNGEKMLVFFGYFTYPVKMAGAMAEDASHIFSK